MKVFIPAICCGLIILVLSLMPGSSLPSFSFIDLFQPDKLGHFVAYGVFTASLLYGFVQQVLPEKIARQTVIKVFLFAISYGVIIELMQYSIFTSRNFEVLDIIANIIGCLVGVLSLKLFT